MQSIAVSSQSSAQSFHLLSKILKVIVPILVLAYVFSQLSSPVQVILTLFTLMALAISSKLDRINTSTINNPIKSQHHYFDGGTFQRPTAERSTANARPAVYDGGSFKKSFHKD